MERRFMAVWFCRLKTDWATLRNRELAKLPLVFSISDQNRLIVTALNAVAETQGVHIGMRVADAKAIVPNLKILNDKLGREEKLLSIIGQWCVRYTPIVALDLPDGLLFNCSGCAHLWGGETQYLEDVVMRFKAKGYTVRAAIADTVGAAWAVARYGERNAIIPANAHKQTVLTLPPVALRLEQPVIDKLHKLGFRRIEAFASIPRASLRRRFGDGLLLRLMQAFGEVEEHIKPIVVPEPYQERLPCLEPIRTRPGIEIAVRQLLETLGLRLVCEGKGIRNATLKTIRVDGKMQQLEIGTNQATCHVEHLFKLFDLCLGNIEPDLGIEVFILEATKIEDIDITQQALWVSKPGLQDNGIMELIDRVAEKIGPQSIHRYLPQERYWPERSIKSTNDPKELPQTTWRSDVLRPIQLLRRPEKIIVSAPIPDDAPMLFRYKDKVHYIKRAEGPERIEREWWIENGEQRDYYSVEDQDGNRYWVFRSGHYGPTPPQWFLHGFFA